MIAPGMFRRARIEREKQGVEDGFRVRGENVSRVEAFSDAVFGFALTLLVVTMSIPKSAADLINLIKGLPVFAVCFVLLYYLWNCHFVYCRRFSLEDGTVRVLTGMLLFTVLFFVYPLKYIFSLFIFGFLRLDPSVHEGTTTHDVATAFVVYGVGWFAMHVFFVFLYRHAYGQRSLLNLSAVEAFRTRRARRAFSFADPWGCFRQSSLLSLLRSFCPSRASAMPLSGRLRGCTGRGRLGRHGRFR